MAPKKDGNLLFYEYAPLPISRTEVGIKASDGLQTLFLTIGDELLGKLPDGVVAKLKTPISADVMAMAAGGNSNGIVPERARTAIMVAETLLVIWEIIQSKLAEGDRRKKRRAYPMEVDKDSGNIFLNEKVVATSRQVVSLISRGMARNTRINYLLVLVMWKVFLRILREGRTSIPIPGLRKKILK